MKFVVSRGDTNNPEFIGIEIPPSTPGFKHARIFPKGFRFEVTDPNKIQKVKEGLFTIEDDGSEKNTEVIRKIKAEVAEEERLKKEEVKRNAPLKKTDWGMIGALAGIAGVAAAVLIYLLTR